MRVLIAEDEKKTRAILVEMVQGLGCETVEAATPATLATSWMVAI